MSGRSVLAAALAAAGLGCPLQRPPVPADYYDFRAELEAAVADTAVVELRGRSRVQTRLDDRLPEFAALLATDSLAAVLAADPQLARLAGAVSAALTATLESERVSGRVRKAFANPDGQRLAVDAMLIGLGRALRRLRFESGG